jgi:hypothetical protein
MIEAFLLLIGLHALCDYPLQGDFLARGKDYFKPLPGVPWYQCLLAHAAIHGLAVGCVLGPGFGIAEFVAHAVTDHLKCAKCFGFNVDQGIHIACKVAWVGLYSITTYTITTK